MREINPRDEQKFISVCDCETPELPPHLADDHEFWMQVDWSICDPESSKPVEFSYEDDDA